MKVVKIESALLKRLYNEPDIEKKVLICREIGNWAKRDTRAVRDIPRSPDTNE